MEQNDPSNKNDLITLIITEISDLFNFTKQVNSFANGQLINKEQNAFIMQHYLNTKNIDYDPACFDFSDLTITKEIILNNLNAKDFYEGYFNEDANVVTTYVNLVNNDRDIYDAFEEDYYNMREDEFAENYEFIKDDYGYDRDEDDDRPLEERIKSDYDNETYDNLRTYTKGHIEEFVYDGYIGMRTQNAYTINDLERQDILLADNYATGYEALDRSFLSDVLNAYWTILSSYIPSLKDELKEMLEKDGDENTFVPILKKWANELLKNNFQKPNNNKLIIFIKRWNKEENE